MRIALKPFLMAEVMSSEIITDVRESTSGRTSSFHLVVKRSRCSQIKYWHSTDSQQKLPPCGTHEVWM
jgi:hypothetical protein